jgi:hypothetical protein
MTQEDRMPEPTQKTTWTWQTILASPGIRCELDGQFFPVSSAPMHVTPDGVLVLWLHHARVRMGECPARVVVANGRRFLVDEEREALRQHTADMSAALLGVLDVMKGPGVNPEEVKALWFIVDEQNSATPRVFRVRAEVLDGRT